MPVIQLIKSTAGSILWMQFSNNSYKREYLFYLLNGIMILNNAGIFEVFLLQPQIPKYPCIICQLVTQLCRATSYPSELSACLQVGTPLLPRLMGVLPLVLV